MREHLASRGIKTYLPLLPPDGKRHGHPRRQRPFFARYLFAYLDLSTVPLSSVNWSQGMVGVVSFGGQPAVVDERVIHWLKARLAQMDPANHHQGLPLTSGVHLRVAAGPLRGMQAVFDSRLSGEDRARVLIKLLGQITACEIPLSWLEQIV